MKKFKGLGAILLAAGCSVVLAGCGGCFSCGGCNSCNGCGNTAKNVTLTSSNWYTDTYYKGIQPSFRQGNEKFSGEELVFDVQMEDGANSSYAVNYANGKYKTSFYGAEYDWTAAGIPENYADEKVNTEWLYFYKTEFTADVQYTRGEENTDTFKIDIITESWFRSAGQNLQPVYAKQDVVNYIPEAAQATNLDGTYVKVDVLYETYYNYYCTEATVYGTDRATDGERTQNRYTNLHKTNNSLFDNSAMDVVLRSMKLSDGSSSAINIFNGFAGGYADYTISGGNTALTEDEKSKISDVMRGAGLLEGDDELNTVTATVRHTASMPGPAATYWYAAVADAANNVSRSTPVKISVPLTFSLGVLNYTLSAVDSTLWAGEAENPQ